MRTRDCKLMCTRFLPTQMNAKSNLFKQNNWNNLCLLVNVWKVQTYWNYRCRSNLEWSWWPAMMIAVIFRSLVLILCNFVQYYKCFFLEEHCSGIQVGEEKMHCNCEPKVCFHLMCIKPKVFFQDNEGKCVYDVQTKNVVKGRQGVDIYNSIYCNEFSVLVFLFYKTLLLKLDF